MMRVVVTGGAGYIGSVVAELLVREGHRVLVIDNLSQGHRDAVQKDAEFAGLDLLDRAGVADALRRFRADAVVHMAAASLVGESVINPAFYYRNNVVAGLSLLDAMQDVGVGRLVFSSTAAVYGEALKQPIDESDPLAPTNPYGETKATFERALAIYGRAHGLSSVSLRYFNAAGATSTHGERHDPETHLIPLVLDVAAGRRPEILIFGDDYPTPDGTCVRDYVHVEDLAAAHLLALGLTETAGYCGTYNLGGGRGYSVREVIAAAERVTGRPIRSRVCARRAGDPAVLVANSDRSRRDLDWSPRYGDLDGIVGSAWSWGLEKNR